MDLKALGFDIAEGVNDPYLPGDCGIFVSKVDKGSIAEGRLRLMSHFFYHISNPLNVVFCDMFRLGEKNKLLFLFTG